MGTPGVPAVLPDPPVAVVVAPACRDAPVQAKSNANKHSSNDLQK
jgi:hypothetical protein